MNDVVVVGGGPAGSAAAITLARAGVPVTLFERECYTTWRAGEHLSPHAGFLLPELGLSLERMDEVHTVAAGRVMDWGAPFTEDYLRHPLGRGWFLNRAQFDHDLSGLAARAGACVHSGVSVTNACRNDGGWRLTLGSGDNRHEFYARFLIEATGRSRIPGLLRSMPRHMLDRQVALVRYLSHSENESDRSTDHWLRIEASQAGWWYQCPLPSGGEVTCHLTDPDLLRGTELEQKNEWLSRLAGTRTIGAHAGTALDFSLRRVSASSYEREDIAGEERLSIGDAAHGVDPLSGQGILRALWMGKQGGKAVISHLEGIPGALQVFEEKVRDGFQLYAAQRQHYYSEVRQWSQSSYWSRRQSPFAWPFRVSLTDWP